MTATRAGKITEALISPPRLAEILDVPLHTLYSWRKRRIGPKAIRVGRHLRYRPADVEAWLVENELEADEA